ncbi:uncharacterized protein MYCGRDRAFT_88585 [Zymoseptoria tritici IPO323]|uniref:Structure-specific endonuclease subunit SLX4 n=1 Tax=Zymoseptoria tritici (strain CBS 115943 / IPO323) TaxID=336722 RepID=F9WXB3_ZYMTI|nr:uncharacterized protein MYCGRDRAFT_88585 [Zymoseptoria tritici IPO323]EGP90807.1 hypothetical protein MYCGRDRAFT_88585 [Zymoseptoria tritici IPO323]
MAAQSPVVIQSSSPELQRLQSITPHNNEKPAEPLTSSSPDLPVPSAFFKLHAPGLSTGSKARQIPQGVSTGFASAASLLRNQAFELSAHRTEEGVEDIEHRKSVKNGLARGEESVKDKVAGIEKEPVNKRARSRKAQEQTDEHDTQAPQPRVQAVDDLSRPSKTATGKLKKTAKSSKSAKSGAESLSRSPLSEFALPAQTSAIRNVSPAAASVSVLAGRQETPDLAASRRTSISLSEFDFNPNSPSSRRTVSPLGKKASVAKTGKHGSSHLNSGRTSASNKVSKSAPRKSKTTESRPKSGSRTASICISEYALQPDSPPKYASPPAMETLDDVPKLRENQETDVAPPFMVRSATSYASDSNILGRSPSQFASRYQYGETHSALSTSEPQQPVISLPVTTDVATAAFKDKAMDTVSLSEQPSLAKAPRKRMPKARQSKGSGPARSKKLAKSASIILNSDEPDLDAGDHAGIAPNPGPPAPVLHVLTEPAAKARKAVKKPRVARGNKEVENATASASANAIVPPLHDMHGGGVLKDIDAQGGFDAHRNAWSQSAYFVDNVIANCQALPLAATEESLQSVFEVESMRRNSTPPPDLPLPHFRRRRSWTPARNTESATVDTPRTVDSGRLEESPPSGPSLAALVSGFGYSAQATSTTANARTGTGEPAVKKRRIELAHETAGGVVVRKAKDAAPAKRVKAVKKKPQTITDLATKAYRAEPEIVAAQSTVSEFFAPQKESLTLTEDAAAGEALTEKPAKVKKTRKRRIKVGGDPEALAAMAERAAKLQKPAKVKKVKFNDANAVPPLLSPQRARAIETQQGFLFGTSSQLAVDDSPTFIRQMQTALRESELMSTLQARFSPRRKSCAKVPSAPHGTSLSIGQAARDLWCTASRDHGGDVLALTERPKAPVVIEQKAHSEEDAHSQYAAETLPVVDALHAIEETTDVIPDAQLDGQEVVDLCATSPAGERAVQDPEPAVFDLPKPEDCDESAHALPSEPHNSDDSWMLLSSDGAEKAEGHASTFPLPMIPNIMRAAPALARVATSPTRLRAALQTLDGNASVLAQKSSARFLQQRAFASATSPPAQKRPRGRPRKDASSTENIPPAQKKRGRPPKSATTFTLPEVKEGRITLPASQQSTSSDFVNIDEIYDSDPPTPSPPRRRAASTSPSVSPLELRLSGSPSPRAKGPAVVTTMLKSGDPQWASISAILFPQITKAVRDIPPSNDMVNPSWHEKILLFDPIVLEDFTGWLNGQGLRVETRKVIPKAKKKGKKKKQDDDTPEVADELGEYELCREEIKPWMAQKWCESKSICYPAIQKPSKVNPSIEDTQAEPALYPRVAFDWISDAAEKGHQYAEQLEEEHVYRGPLCERDEENEE